MKNDIDFICMGFTKCGTTWLYNILSQNSALDNPKLKEPCYYTENFHRGENWQLSLYKNNGGIKTDFTNHYIFNQGAIELIKKNCPKAKLLLLIRNPIERSISHFKMAQRLN